jgi:hypothetical protein
LVAASGVLAVVAAAAVLVVHVRARATARQAQSRKHDAVASLLQPFLPEGEEVAQARR